MPLRVELTSAAKRDLRRLSPQIQARLLEPILALTHNPRPVGVRKVSGEEKTWRIRVGQYRVIYDIYDDQELVIVLKVDRRRESTYRL